MLCGCVETLERERTDCRRRFQFRFDQCLDTLEPNFTVVVALSKLFAKVFCLFPISAGDSNFDESINLNSDTPTETLPRQEFTLPVAAQMLGVSLRTVQRRLLRGDLTSIERDGQRLVLFDSILNNEMYNHSKINYLSGIYDTDALEIEVGQKQVLSSEELPPQIAPVQERIPTIDHSKDESAVNYLLLKNMMGIVETRML